MVTEPTMEPITETVTEMVTEPVAELTPSPKQCARPTEKANSPAGISAVQHYVLISVIVTVFDMVLIISCIFILFDPPKYIFIGHFILLLALASVSGMASTIFIFSIPAFRKTIVEHFVEPIIIAVHGLFPNWKLIVVHEIGPKCRPTTIGLYLGHGLVELVFRISVAVFWIVAGSKMVGGGLPSPIILRDDMPNQMHLHIILSAVLLFTFTTSVVCIVVRFFMAGYAVLNRKSLKEKVQTRTAV